MIDKYVDRNAFKIIDYLRLFHFIYLDKIFSRILNEKFQLIAR